MFSSRVIAASLLFGLGLHSAAAHAGCEKDTDCKGEQICSAGACTDATGAPPPAPPVQQEKPVQQETPVQQEKPVQQGDASGWWKKDAREKEAALLQEIFNELPKPVKTKGKGKLVYQRSVPLVIWDIHDVTAVWGSKLQKDVHFVGISKIHTTQALKSIGPDTAGIAFCPVNCDRISEIFVNDEQITLQYDGPIKDWAGKAADNVAGYTRQYGKIHQAKCSFPLMVKHAPPSTWTDPQQVVKVRTAIVAELKRYCGK